ncbi:hypothetical protein GGS21DRAFT_67547 [Xylaria nigripes]|nr:hypothetical protein GGS21DRAFT_67547 [Xylaria nigripes]
MLVPLKTASGLRPVLVAFMTAFGLRPVLVALMTAFRLDPVLVAVSNRGSHPPPRAESYPRVSSGLSSVSSICGDLWEGKDIRNDFEIWEESQDDRDDDDDQQQQQVHRARRGKRRRIK